jgi:hypothetical protein
MVVVKVISWHKQWGWGEWIATIRSDKALCAREEWHGNEMRTIIHIKIRYINAKIWMNGGMDRGRNCGRRGGRGWRTNMEMGWIVTSTDSSSLIPSRKCALWPSHITIRWIKKVLIYFFCVKANEIGGGGLTNVAAGLHFAPFYQE